MKEVRSRWFISKCYSRVEYISKRAVGQLQRAYQINMSFISIPLHNVITGLGRGEFDVVEPVQMGKRADVWTFF